MITLVTNDSGNGFDFDNVLAIGVDFLKTWIIFYQNRAF
jgi:hypothetical protein